MATRKKTPMPLDVLRSKVAKHGSELLDLKVRLVDVEQRLAKAETALGTVAKGGMPPNVLRERLDDERLETE